MTSTKAQPGPFDGLMKAQADEPVFPLVAHDPLAPDLVQEWVDRRRKAINRAWAKGSIAEEKRDLELVQCREAEEIAEAMRDWYKGAEAQPELPDEKSQSYTGHSHTDEQRAAIERHTTCLDASRIMNDAVAEVTDAAERLEKYGFADEREAMLQAVKGMKIASEAVRPKRAGWAVTDEDRARVAAAAS